MYKGINQGVEGLVNKVTTKINVVQKSRHTIYLRKDLVRDSSFPFKVGEPLTVKIDGNRLVIEKTK